MAIEIERKFLVTDSSYKDMCKSFFSIKQGYICADKERTVRVRIRDGKGFLTIKGESSADGLSRYEWEQLISADEAEELMKLCLPGVIDKTRYLVEYEGHVFEVDEFHGDNSGLVMAEVELRSEDETFSKPHFLGCEVTGDKRYYNSSLMERPYNLWNKP